MEHRYPDGRRAIVLSHGPFNPVHNGHINMVALASTALEAQGYEVIRCIFALAPRESILKHDVDAIEDRHRLEALRLICSGRASTQPLVVDPRGIDFPDAETMLRDLLVPEVQNEVPNVIGVCLLAADSVTHLPARLSHPLAQFGSRDLSGFSSTNEAKETLIRAAPWPIMLGTDFVFDTDRDSTRLRSALANGNARILNSLCPPAVADYLLARRGELFAENCWQCHRRFVAPHGRGRYLSGWLDPVGGLGWRGPHWYCCDCWSSWRQTLVVGLTGPTKAGKSTLAEGVCAALHASDAGIVSCEVVQQDFHRTREEFWMKHRDVHLPDWDSPERCDIRALLISVEEAAARSRVVLVEGFCLMHDKRVRALFDRVVWLELDESTCRERRVSHWPDGWHSSDEYFDECVWPAHKRYKVNRFDKSSNSVRGFPNGHTLTLSGIAQPEQLVDQLVQCLRGWLSEQDVALEQACQTTSTCD